MKRIFINVTFAALLVAVAGLFRVQQSTVSAQVDDNDNITICHRTNSVRNPYVELTISIEGSNGQSLNDHTQHTGPVAVDEATAQALKNNKQKWGDIIPAFGDYEGLNWNEDGIDIYENGCQSPEITEVVPTAPTFKDPTCTVKGSYTITATEGVEYSVNGTVTAAGTYQVANGAVVTITAEAMENFFVPDGTTDSWTHTFTAPTNCSTPSVLGTTTPQVVAKPKGAVNAGEQGNTNVALIGLICSGVVTLLGLALGRKLN
jgi:hypothetical protein